MIFTLIQSPTTLKLLEQHFNFDFALSCEPNSANKLISAQIIPEICSIFILASIGDRCDGAHRGVVTVLMTLWCGDGVVHSVLQRSVVIVVVTGLMICGDSGGELWL